MSWNKKAIKQLIELSEYNKFSELIKGCRNKIGIPENGFTEDLGYGDIVKDDNRFCNTLAMYAKKIVSEYNLSQSMQPMIEDYLMYDSVLTDSSGEHILTDGYNIDIDFTGDEDKYLRTGKPRDYVVIKIYPGAERSDVNKLLNKAWPKIKHYLFKKDPNKYKHRVKAKPKKERDTKIFNLYRMKIIKYGGTFNQRAAEEYLKKEGVDKYDNFVKGFRVLIKDFPNSPEARRKIIQEHKRKQKN